MFRISLGPCLLATTLFASLGCEETLENLGEVCHAPVLTVTTADVDGAPPNVFCDPDTLTCSTLQQAFNTVSMCREIDQTVALLPEAIYEVRYVDSPITDLGRAHADQVDALGASGLPSIVGFVTIQGNGATLRQVGTRRGRLLNVLPDSELVVRDLIFEDAVSTGDGAAVSNAGTLTLEQVAFRENTGLTLEGARGGAIYNASTLVVRDSEFIANQAAQGGSIYNASAATARVERSYFSEHVGLTTALTNAEGAALVVTDSLFEGNRGDDGAIDSRGDLTVVGSTFTGNEGINAASIFVLGGTARVERSTFSGETARSTGAINCADLGSIEIVDSTLVGNTAETGLTGGVMLGGSCTVSFSNSVVAGNTPADCLRPHPSAEANLDSDGSCGFSLTGEADLGPLTDNGGATPTHLPDADSPLVDAGTTCLPTDQAGATRPASGGCDIGSMER